MTVDEILAEIKEKCIKYNAGEVFLFGSRAKGTARERSDIDIAVSGACNIDMLREEIDDIPTLYKVDIVDLDTCKNDILKEDIFKYGRKI